MTFCRTSIVTKSLYCIVFKFQLVVVVKNCIFLLTSLLLAACWNVKLKYRYLGYHRNRTVSFGVNIVQKMLGHIHTQLIAYEH